MSTLDRNRTRLLIISKNQVVRNDLVTLLTGYGYYVDYTDGQVDGLRKFEHHKHPVVILDVEALPRNPQRLFNLFRAYRHNPIILIAAHEGEESRVYPYLDSGVYDIINLPLKVEYLHFVLRRVVQFNHLNDRNTFFRIALLVVGLTVPVWILFALLLPGMRW